MSVLDGAGVPHQHQLLVVEGDSFATVFALADGDGDAIALTGLLGRAQVRDTPGGSVLVSLSVAVDQAALGDGETVGHVTVSASPSDTDGDFRGVWDLELVDSLTSPTFRRTVVSGAYVTLPQITE